MSMGSGDCSSQYACACAPRSKRSLHCRRHRRRRRRRRCRRHRRLLRMRPSRSCAGRARMATRNGKSPRSLLSPRVSAAQHATRTRAARRSSLSASRSSLARPSASFTIPSRSTRRAPRASAARSTKSTNGAAADSSCIHRRCPRPRPLLLHLAGRRLTLRGQQSPHHRRWVAGLLLVLVVGGVWYRAKKHEARSKSLPLEACEVAPAELVIASRPKSVELVETS